MNFLIFSTTIVIIVIAKHVGSRRIVKEAASSNTTREKLKIKDTETRQPRQGTVVRVTFQSTSTLIRAARTVRIREAGGRAEKRNQAERNTMRHDYREYNGTPSTDVWRKMRTAKIAALRDALFLSFPLYLPHLPLPRDIRK